MVQNCSLLYIFFFYLSKLFSDLYISNFEFEVESKVRWRFRKILWLLRIYELYHVYSLLSTLNVREFSKNQSFTYLIKIYVPKIFENGNLKTVFYLDTISCCCQKWPSHCEAFKWLIKIMEDKNQLLSFWKQLCWFDYLLKCVQITYFDMSGSCYKIFRRINIISCLI